ncbi:hypothetical protein D3C85_1208070 [compost metagenome]
MLQRRVGIDHRPHLAELPAFDHGDHIVRDLALHHLLDDVERRDAGLELVAAGLEVGAVAGDAGQQLEQARVHRHAAALDLAADAGDARAGLDHHFHG